MLSYEDKNWFPEANFFVSRKKIFVSWNKNVKKIGKKIWKKIFEKNNFEKKITKNLKVVD